MIPADRMVVGESGLFTPSDLARLARVRVNAFLIGESLMRKENVRDATYELLHGQPRVRKSQQQAAGQGPT